MSALHIELRSAESRVREAGIAFRKKLDAVWPEGTRVLCVLRNGQYIPTAGTSLGCSFGADGRICVRLDTVNRRGKPNR